VKVHLSLLFAAASILSTTTIPKSTYAEGGCPSGMYPNGGYCRDVKCFTYGEKAYDKEVAQVLKTYGKACRPTLGVPGIARWGDKIVPMR